MSKLANEILKEALFQKGKSRFGELKVVSAKDIIEEEAHEELYR